MPAIGAVPMDRLAHRIAAVEAASAPDDDGAALHRIVSKVGRRVDQTTPLADARLLDGSRVNVIVPPCRCAAPRSRSANSPRSRSRST